MQPARRREYDLVRQSDPLPDEFLDDVETAARALVVVWGRSAERLRPKVSPSQLRALIVVDRHATINLMSLADELGSIPSVTSRLCDRLQAAGLLVREVSVGDRREIVLKLSRDGRRLLRQFRRDRKADLEAVLQQMNPRSRSALRTGLEAFYSAANELGIPDRELA